MEYKLHLGLIYICTRGLDDYITPLVKFVSTMLILNNTTHKTEETDKEK